MFKIKEFYFENKEIKIIFDTDKTIDNDIYLSLRTRDKDVWNSIEYDQEIAIKSEKIEEEYVVTINLNMFLNLFTSIQGQKNIVDIHVKNSDGYYNLKHPFNGKKFNESYDYTPLNKLSKIKPYITKGNKIALKIQANNIDPIIKEVAIIENSVKFFLDFPSGQTIYPKAIIIGKKIFDLQLYRENIYLQQLDNYEYEIEKEQLNLLGGYESKTKLDITALFEEDNISFQYPIKIKNSLNVQEIELTNNVKAKINKNSQNMLQMHVEKTGFDIYLESYEILDNSIQFKINAKNLLSIIPIENVSVSLDREFKIRNKREYIFFENIEFTNLEENLILVHIDFNDFLDRVNSSRSQTFKLIVSYTIQGKKYSEKIIIKEPHKYRFRVESLQINMNGKSFISFDMMKVQGNPYKLAIVGSCYSRSAFNSQKKFFNPDYKDFFQIVYTNFQPSIASMNSEKVEFDKNKYLDLSEADLMNVEREYKKSIFQDLEENDFDYLIIDFFVDATHGVILLDDNKILGLNSSIKRSNYYRNHLSVTTTLLNNKKPEFLELWRKSCDEFINKIIKIVPSNKIILNKGGLIDKFYDENNDLHSFIDKGYISKSEYEHFNTVWEYMNSYFLNELPDAHYLDLTSYNYIGSIDHPVNAGPHHFESRYYKSYIDKLLKIIVFNERSTQLQNNRD
ncbi:DUF6270 domain-containing protein [Niallia sp. NCCP-28]|uniref:DUF6270 domain-containing protein n=1 Tax=Niallia sp. NCCP-28 TaxID=2934712 RepID=UPI002086ECFA|nr:DUF6270 domain-containing protein [Niallia sp. NCCP-28]GKU83425.1 hypothetical protein NCCP28_28210 [Niallia sp. NCCP-28]